MPANCPHCSGKFTGEGVPMRKQSASKTLWAIEYYCPSCGQHFTKVKGQKGYHKGQILGLPRR
jgi:DNA-directed RNA polymerase subunit RPC12/RpoP